MNGIGNQMGFNPFANFNHSRLHNHQSTAGQSESRQDNPLSLSNKSAVGMKLVYQAISVKFSSSEQAIANETSVSEPQAKSVDEVHVFDFNKVAENVMSFVNSSLQAAKARGATTSELEEMLGQARMGANQGIDEAIAELADLNLLDDELVEGIEQSRGLISTAMDDIAIGLTSEDDAQIISLPTPTSQAIEYSSERYNSSSNSSDLSITTADGDIVTISFSALKERQSSESFGYYQDPNSTAVSYQSSSSSYSELNFSYSVEGDLDDEERQAINDLIKDVSKIEHAFFNGNIEKAFDKALKLGYDQEQLSSFSLELRQTQTSYVSQTYQEIANYNENEAPELATTVRPVLDFVEQFHQIREKADKILSDQQSEFDQLLASVFNAEFNNNQQLLTQFTDFIEQLN